MKLSVPSQQADQCLRALHSPLRDEQLDPGQVYLALDALGRQRPPHHAREIGPVFEYGTARNLKHGRPVLVPGGRDREEVLGEAACQGVALAEPGEPQGPVV
ncbi:hypothetical protein PG984_013121 [Apiospora sp. TS-2023a]